MALKLATDYNRTAGIAALHAREQFKQTVLPYATPILRDVFCSDLAKIIFQYAYWPIDYGVHLPPRETDEVKADRHASGNGIVYTWQGTTWSEVQAASAAAAAEAAAAGNDNDNNNNHTELVEAYAAETGVADRVKRPRRE